MPAILHSNPGPQRRTALLTRVLLVVWASLAGLQAGTPVDFNREIRPVLSEHCYACHGPDDGKRKAGLRLDEQESALAPLKSGHRAIVPGHPESSSLVQRLTTRDADDLMPPPAHGKPLQPAQIELLTRWVKEGAPWRRHWSFIPPEKPPLPSVRRSSWPSNPIDRFVLAKLEQAGLAPTADADKSTLLRRVTFDLTGLPPTPEEVDAFQSDRSSQAYERVVDRLLASPRYGERMAVQWLDLARYADTAGYHFDGVRFMWLWRDWVIHAFNSNKPYDVFTVEQWAGDLLPHPTREQRIATGFVRNNMTNDEGGADPDEYLNKYVADRVNTLGAVWLGMTVGCAECHDHKFDPLRTREFYELYAFFHNVPEKGLDRIRTDNPPPRLPVATDLQAHQFVEANFRVRDAEKTLQDRSNELGETQEKWERETVARPPHPSDTNAVLAHWSFEGQTALTLPASLVLSNRWAGPAAPEFTNGQLGQALKLDGQSSLDISVPSDFFPTQGFSFGGWIKSASNGAVLSKMEKSPGFRGFDLFSNDGRLEVHFIHQYPDGGLKVRTRDKIESGAWQHVLVTYDGSTKAAGLRLYVNGRSRDLDVEKDQLSGPWTNEEPLRLGSRHQEARWTGSLDELVFYRRVLSAEEAQALTLEGLLPVIRISRGQRTESQRQDLQRVYKDAFAVDYLRAEKALAQARQWSDKLLSEIPTTMIMEEMEPPRETYRLVRGDFRNRAERVFPNTPAFLPALAKAQICNDDGRLRLRTGPPPVSSTNYNRLDLAAWLIDPAHPLTARVTVNRYWALFFGQGLVKTINDFGAQGEWPSHPELLDWLACRFRDGEPRGPRPVAAWDVKALVRLIVTSRTYRQAALVTPDRLEKDAYNRLFTRGPRLPLDAEFVRDNALFVSGLMDPRVGGASVKPYQPPGLWDGTDSVFVQDHGADLYRRGLYVYWRRSAHYPAFAAFDAPNREVCTFLRQRTQTPLQSLVLMNDPAFVECARGLAQRVIREEPQQLQRRLLRAFRLTLGRTPAPAELATLQRTYDQQLAHFTANPPTAQALLAVGEAKRPENADPIALAALTAVANVLLNLNETITH